MAKSAWATEPNHQEIHDARSLDALLLTDLSTHLGSAPEVQDWHELGQSVHQAALAQLLCVLAEGVARHDPCDQACKGRNKERRRRRNEDKLIFS